MKTKYKAGVYILAVLLVILLSVYTTDLLYFTRFPAFALFGLVLIAFFLFLEIVSLFVCPICKGMGALNLTLWQELINSFNPGYLGERCTNCNGRGFVNIRRFYEDQLKKEEET